MKKHLGVMGILFVGILGVGLVTVNQLIRYEIARGLQNSIDPLVTIGAIDIRLPRHIVLHQLRIADPCLPTKTLAAIQSVDLEINPGYFLHRNQTGYLLKKVVVSKPQLYIRHFEDDTYNVMKLLKPDTKGVVLFERLPIEIKDGSATYIDRRGFDLKPLPKDHISKIDQLTGRIWILKNKVAVQANFRIIQGGQGRVKLTGTQVKEHFEVQLRSRSAEVADLTQYIGNLKDIQLKQLKGAIAVRLSDKPVMFHGDIPLRFDVSLACQKADLQTTWVAPPIQVNAGTVRATNQGVFFDRLQGESAGVPFLMEGAVNNFTSVNVSIRNERLNAQNIPAFLPFLKTWNLDGAAAFEMTVKSADAGKVAMTGSFKGYDGHVLQYKVEKADLEFNRVADIVSLNITSMEAYGGRGAGSARIHITPKGSDNIRFDLDLKQVDLQQYFGGRHFQGNGDVSIHLQDNPSAWNGSVKFAGKTATVFGQPLQQASLLLHKTSDRLQFLDGSMLALGTNAEPVGFTGQLLANSHFDVAIKAKNIESDNLYFLQTKKGNYQLKFGVVGAFEGEFNNAFKVDPIAHIRGKGDIVVNEASVHDIEETLSGNGTVVFDKDVKLNVALQNIQSTLNIALSASSKGLKQARMAFEDVNLNQLKGILRSTPVDYSGRASGSLDIFPQNNQLILKGFAAKGQVSLENGHYGEQGIDRFNGTIDLHSNHLKVESGEIQTGLSRVYFDTDFQTTRDVEMTLRPSTFRSSDFPQFPKTWRLTMQDLSGQVTRRDSVWALDIAANTDTMIYKNVELPDWHGRLRYDKGHVGLKDFRIAYKEDEYRCEGNVWLEPGKKPEYQLKVNFVRGHLETIAELIMNIRPLVKGGTLQEITETRSPLEDGLTAYDELISKNLTNLYSLHGKDIAHVLQGLSTKTVGHEQAEGPRIEGVVRGHLFVENREGRDLLGSDLALENIQFKETKIKKVRLLAEQKGPLIELAVQADQMMLQDSQFDSVHFQANYNPETHTVFIQDLQSQQGEQTYKQILTGRVCLGPWLAEEQEKSDDVDLNLNLERQNINILAFFSNALQGIHNEGDIKVHLYGSRSDLHLDANKFELKTFVLQFRPGFPIRSALRIDDAKLTLKDNVLTMPSVTLSWKGADTNLNENKFVISGTVRSSLSLKDLSTLPLTFMLVVQPTQLDLNLADLYVGKASVELTTLDGTLFVPLTSKARELMRQKVVEEKEEGPLLTTRVSLSEGRFVIMANRPAVIDKPMVRLNSSVLVAKDLYLGGQNMDAGVNNFLNNLYVELEELPTPLRVKGSLNTIELEHRFLLKEGRLVFMNQIFKLLEKPLQRDVFRDHPELIEDNVVEIKMMPDAQYPTKRKAMPFFNLKAYAQIQKETSSSDNVQAKIEDHVFVIYVNGFLNSAKSFSVEHYLVDKGRYGKVGERVEIEKMTSEQLDSLASYLLPVLLRPQFYQNLLSKGLGNNKEANDLFRNYSANQINLWLDQQLRPLEKNVAKATGLYDIRIQHKLGEEIMNAVPVFSTDTSSQSSDTSKLSVQYIKDLFAKQLFVKAKTGLTQDPSSRALALRLTDYELMWYINNFISLNYANHNVQNSDSFYGAFSLNANFDF